MITIVDLPLDVLITIFSYLDYRDLKSVLLTCRSLKEIVLNSAIIWLKKSKRELVTNELFPQYVQRCYVPLTPYERCRISRNWKQGVYVGKLIIKHQTHYMPWVQLTKDRMYISVGHQIRCYSRGNQGVPATNSPLWSLQGPHIDIYNSARQNNDVTRFVYKNNLILLGNSNGSISAFSYSKPDYVNGLHILNDKSKKSSFQPPKLLLHAKRCHENGAIEVTCVDFHLNYNDFDVICTGSRYDKNIKICKVLERSIGTTSSNIHINNDYQLKNLKPPRLKVVHDIKIADRSRTGALCLQVNEKGNMLCCGLYGNAHPLLINIETGQKILDPFQEYDICQATTDLQWLNKDIILMTSHAGMVTCTDIRCNKVVYSVSDPFGASLFCVKTDGANSIIAGASQHSRCVLYDIRNSRDHVQIYFTDKGQSSRVYGLDFDSTILVAALDRRVACLNFNVNSATTPTRDYGRRFVHMM